MDSQLTLLGKMLASGGDDRSVRLWSLVDGSSRRIGEVPGRVHRLDWDSKGARIAASTSTGEVYLWSAATGETSASFVAHPTEANSIRFSPHGEMAVSVGDDGVLRLWDTATWRPKWFTQAVVHGPQLEVLTHTGWHAVDSSRRLVSARPASSAWRRAIEAAHEATSLAGGPVCVTAENGLEIWDAQSDSRSAAQSIVPPFEVAAVAGGCSVLKNGRVTLYRKGQAPVELAEGASLQSGGELLTVVGTEVTQFDPRQARGLGTFGAGAGITAAAPLGKLLAVGFRDGYIELRKQGERVPVFFQNTPGSAVTRLEAGPKDMLAAGFVDGSFGIWSSATGERLERGAVHGAVRHLAISGDLLTVASEVGATANMDLSPFTSEYCELLGDVWSRVPVVWRDQGALEQAPDRSHGCMTRQRSPEAE
jgi:WD40 repeat protein